MDSATGALDQVQELGQAEVLKHLNDNVKKAVEDSLIKIEKEAGDLCAAEVTKKYPALKKVSGVVEKAEEVATEAVMSQKGLIMDFVEAAQENFDENFPKIGSLALKAAKGACEDAVNKVLEMIPFVSCLKCCPCTRPDAEAIKTDCIQKIQDMFKSVLKDLIAKEATDAVQNEINLKVEPLFEKFDADADVGEPPRKSAPEQEEMGAVAET